MRIEDARSLYPGLKDKIFLDAACLSLAPLSAKNEMEKFMQKALFCLERDASERHSAMDSWRQKTQSEIAALFRVPDLRVALIENTSQGLNIAANTIPFKAGDEVVIFETEFLQVAIPFVKKEEQGHLRIVRLQAFEDFCLKSLKEIINSHTRAICISSVQWCTGERLPMDEIGAFCQQRGIWLIVDGVHEAGALEVDLSQRYADFYVAGGHKWLNSPFGCGLMIMSPRAIELQPPSFGYLSLDAPQGGWGSYFQSPAQSPFRAYDFPPSAKAFETGGTRNYPGAIALGESLKIVNILGIHAVETRILALARLLRSELHNLELNIISPKAIHNHSGITVFNSPHGPSHNLQILKALLDQNILVSIRYTANRGGIRVSTHYFNNEEDVIALCSALRKL